MVILLTVKEAKATGLIDPRYADDLSDICEPFNGNERGCGSPLLITETLSEITCSNPRCNLKLAGRASRMLKALGVKGIGYGYCRDLIYNTGMTSHLEILVADMPTLLKSGKAALSENLYNQLQVALKRSFTYPQMVKLLNLPELSDRALVLFKWCRSLSEFYAVRDYHGLTTEDFIKRYKGFDSKLAKDISNTIDVFEPELSLIDKFFKVLIEPDMQWKIAVTGEVKNLSVSISRQDVARYYNAIGKGHVGVVVGKSLTTCKYIIADENSGSSTFEAGVMRQHEADAYYHDCMNKYNMGLLEEKPVRQEILITSDRLEEIILEVVKEYEGVEK